MAWESFTRIKQSPVVSFEVTQEDPQLPRPLPAAERSQWLAVVGRYDQGLASGFEAVFPVVILPASGTLAAYVDEHPVDATEAGLGLRGIEVDLDVTPADVTLGSINVGYSNRDVAGIRSGDVFQGWESFVPDLVGIGAPTLEAALDDRTHHYWTTEGEAQTVSAGLTLRSGGGIGSTGSTEDGQITLPPVLSNTAEAARRYGSVTVELRGSGGRFLTRDSNVTMEEILSGSYRRTVGVNNGVSWSISSSGFVRTSTFYPRRSLPRFERPREIRIGYRIETLVVNDALPPHALLWTWGASGITNLNNSTAVVRLVNNTFRADVAGSVILTLTDLAGTRVSNLVRDNPHQATVTVTSTAQYSSSVLKSYEKIGFRISNSILSGDDDLFTQTLLFTATPLGSVDGITAVATNEGVILTWTTHGTDPAITKWQSSSDNGVTWFDIDGSGSSTVRAVLTGLTNGTSYRVSVRPAVGAQFGPGSAPIVETPVAHTPATPDRLTGTAGVNEVSLTWRAPTDNRVSAWQYRQRIGSGAYGSWTDMTGATAPTRAFTVSGLTNGTSYTFQVRSVAGTAFSTPTGTVTRTPVAHIPLKPTSLTATDPQTGGRIRLNWTAVTDALIDGWQYSDDNGSTWKEISGSVANSRQYTVTGLTNGTAYTFRVRSKAGDARSPASDSATATPTLYAPAQVTGLAAAAGNAQVVLTWTALTDNRVTKYQYRQRTGTGSWGSWTDATTSRTSTSYTVTGLTNGTAYGFQVRGNDNGAASTEVTATPRARQAAATFTLTATQAANANQQDLFISTGITITQTTGTFTVTGGTLLDIADQPISISRWRGLTASAAGRTAFGNTRLTVDGAVRFGRTAGYVLLIAGRATRGARWESGVTYTVTFAE